MKELLNILDRTTELHQSNQRYALATVVKIGGSTYRRPGARMLITEAGEHWGTISGGCLEGEVAQQALAVIDSQEPHLLPFNLEEDDIVLGFGTGCNGIVHVLIQPVTPGKHQSCVDALLHCINQRQRGVMATLISQEGADTGTSQNVLGQHLILLEGGSDGPSSLPVPQDHALRVACKKMLDDELQQEQIYLWQTDSMMYNDSRVEVLFEIVRPPVHLHVFGEGHDVGAVVDQARTMGWDITIIGRKPVDILQSRFPNATGHTFLMHPEQVASHIKPDARSAALVMNHAYIRDRSLLHALLHTEMPYVGMLGPKERTETMLKELAEENKPIPSSALNRLFGPVGLDIGTETPEEIALSVIAEVQAALHQRSGGSLRARQGPIHASRTPIEAFQ